ncbi:hypothetical protein FA048_01645 [Pedobacter polaris]|uniref:Uncharacterized protein n=1 Tax=Pedobacter polaris TaxID=2571273 RepID=A0A4U1CXW5_9SPHI|nr:hypothetical protein [Pedobacter polaris]TKC12349.1 hypothetical protein FA048_01645 [Pedobacter polaris]
MENEQLPNPVFPNTGQEFQVPIIEDKTEEVNGAGFEKFKYKVEVAKWLIGTVGLTLITYFINWGFKDRESGMLEISQYDKYATELIVLNDNPIKRRMLAQFFANVTPSEKLKDGWTDYYREVNNEYVAFIKSDSLNRARLVKINRIDSNKLSQSEKIEKDLREKKAKQDAEIINASIVIPENSIITQATVYIQAVSTSKEYAEKIRSLLISSGFKVPSIEYMDRTKYIMSSNQIRYFRNEDVLITDQLKTILESDNVITNTKYLPVLNKNTKQGIVELWLK